MLVTGQTRRNICSVKLSRFTFLLTLYFILKKSRSLPVSHFSFVLLHPLWSICAKFFGPFSCFKLLSFFFQSGTLISLQNMYVISLRKKKVYLVSSTGIKQNHNKLLHSLLLCRPCRARPDCEGKQPMASAS